MDNCLCKFLHHPDIIRKTFLPTMAKKTRKLNRPDFIDVVKRTPLVSIDIIVENGRNQVLLGLRKNEPAKGFWFVPGGRILKNERIADAFRRIARENLALALTYEKADFVGVFEHLYPGNFTGKKQFSTHYVVLAHRIALTKNLKKFPTTEHSRYQWFEKARIPKDRKVHPYTKAYFR